MTWRNETDDVAGTRKSFTLHLPPSNTNTPHPAPDYNPQPSLMRITSWNVNGIRAFRQHAPWYTLGTMDAVLEELGADIACFQEVKSPRNKLTKDVVVPAQFDSFWDLSGRAYSGTVCYTRREAGVTPCAAVSGLVSASEIGPALDLADVRLHPEYTGGIAALDNEGRTVMLDLGLFVLINVYCPALADENRLPFKMSYHALLTARIAALLQTGREVILLGDLNAVHQPIDHCDGNELTRLPEGLEAFFAEPHRKWLADLLHPDGPLIDICRELHPQRKKMYTCWNTLINARPANYGSRIDYILISDGLRPWVKDADIQPDIQGSDHCPVYLDFHQSIPDAADPSRQIFLKDVLSDCGTCPPQAGRFWDEFSGRQRLLSSFFGKPPPIDMAAVIARERQSSIPETVSRSPSVPVENQQQAVPQASVDPVVSVPAQKRPRRTSGQQMTSTVTHILSESEEDEVTSVLPSVNPSTKSAWSTIMSPRSTPLCDVHKEPAKVYTVNKTGPNKGKQFYLCARPVGPGYDTGARKRRREDVDIKYRCNFFMWATDIPKRPPLNSPAG